MSARRRLFVYEIRHLYNSFREIGLLHNTVQAFDGRRRVFVKPLLLGSHTVSVRAL